MGVEIIKYIEWGIDGAKKGIVPPVAFAPVAPCFPVFVIKEAEGVFCFFQAVFQSLDA